MRRALQAAAASTGLLFGCLAMADSLHYNNVLIGDRAMGLGGAYTAISDDASGLFYNPAGVVYAGKRNLSASVNALTLSDITYKSVLGGEDWERSSSTFRPNFFGILQPFGDLIVGFSFAVTDAILEDQDSRFTDLPGIREFVINLNNEDSTIKVGPSVAGEINDNLSWGATLYLHSRSRETHNNQWIRLVNDQYEWSNTAFETDETGVEPVVGLMWSPFEQWSFGVSLRRTFLVDSASRVQNTCASDINDAAVQAAQCLIGGPGATPLDPEIETSDEKRELPLQLGLGLAYFPSPKLLLALDLNYFSATDSELRGEAVLNLAAGLEYYVGERWALRGGLFSNLANTPEIDTGDQDRFAHVDYYGASFSLSRFTRNSSITGGVNFSVGEGKAQVLSGSPNIQDVEATALSLFLSTSYSY